MIDNSGQISIIPKPEYSLTKPPFKYFTNLDFPEIAGDVPSKTLPFRVRSSEVAII